MPTPTNGSSNNLEESIGENGSGVSSGGSMSVSEIIGQPAFAAAASILLERSKFASLAGFDTHSGSREIFKVLGYPAAISFRDYQSRFRRGGIAKRIVKALPSMMGWSDFQIVERPIDEGYKRKTRFEQAYINLTTRDDNPISVGSIFKRADILAGIGEYSAIYIGVKDKLGVSLKEEMSRLKSPNDVIYLRPLDQESCEIIEWIDKEEDKNDSRYGMPRIYRVKINGADRRSIAGNSIVSSTSIDVHWSRIIHVTHEPLDNELFSQPVLEAVWNYLIDLDKLAGGGSEAVWKEAVQRVLFDLDQNIGPDQIDAATKDKLKNDLEEMMHNLKQYVFSRGVTPKPVGGSDRIKFGENVKTIISLIAATMDLPQRRIMGSESAYASADQDKNTEEETIQSRQKEYGTPLVRQLVDRLIKFGALPKPSKYEVVWAVEGKKKLKALAGIVRDLAQANQAQKNATGQPVTTSDEIRDMVLDMEALEVVEVETKEVEEEVAEKEKVEDEPEIGEETEDKSEGDALDV
jgi:uncharacterized protein